MAKRLGRRSANLIIHSLLVVPSGLKLCAEIPEELSVRVLVECIEFCIGQVAYHSQLIRKRPISRTVSVLNIRLTAYSGRNKLI